MKDVNQEAARRLENTIFESIWSQTGKKNLIILFIKICPIMIYTDLPPYINNKKGLTSINACKPLWFMVGTGGFEPPTSTVSG